MTLPWYNKQDVVLYCSQTQQLEIDSIWFYIESNETFLQYSTEFNPIYMIVAETKNDDNNR